MTLSTSLTETCETNYYDKFSSDVQIAVKNALQSNENYTDSLTSKPTPLEGSKYPEREELGSNLLY